ncbi:MFS family permease [Nocardioides thalensis]|uniref:MFS family permease n=1 Tax=Nocardioides thalensis TaxID=1914755 RepID=A0A853BZT3_9ACTN|nr:MFS transporter [Nocardioides thalensis]NYJ00407.1 MFS family permease [Nocardioides thalensis]
MSEPRVDNPAVAALKVPAFRRYLVGQLPSVTGSWAQVVALSWVVVERDPHALGWVVALQFAPSLLLGPWFGVLVDRHDRKRMLIAAEAGLGGVGIAYAVASASGALDLPLIYVLATVWGLLNALDTPARRALVPMLVPRELSASAGALTGVAMLLGMTAGSAVGAALTGALDPAVAFAVNAATFLVDVLLLWTIRVSPSPQLARAPGQVREGLRYVWRTPTLRTPLLALAVIATFAFSVQVSVPIFVRETLHGGASLLGTAFTSATTGSLLGAAVAAARGEPGPATVPRACLGMAAASAAIVAAPTVPVAVLAMAGVGFSWSILIAAVLAALQTAEPDKTGRVMATLSVVLLGGLAAGGPIAAQVADLAGPRAPFAVGAVAGIAAFVVARERVRRLPVAAAEGPGTSW